MEKSFRNSYVKIVISQWFDWNIFQCIWKKLSERVCNLTSKGENESDEQKAVFAKITCGLRPVSVRFLFRLCLLKQNADMHYKGWRLTTKSKISWSKNLQNLSFPILKFATPQHQIFEQLKFEF